MVSSLSNAPLSRPCGCKIPSIEKDDVQWTGARENTDQRHLSLTHFSSKSLPSVFLNAWSKFPNWSFLPLLEQSFGEPAEAVEGDKRDNNTPRDHVFILIGVLYLLKNPLFYVRFVMRIIFQVFFGSFPNKIIVNFETYGVVCNRDHCFAPRLKRFCAIRESEGCLEPSAIRTTLTSDVKSKLD